VLRYFRTQDLLDEADANGMLSWQGSGGFSIDAEIEGSLQYLLQYLTLPRSREAGIQTPGPSPEKPHESRHIP
jgi:hypothetical protein